MADIFRGPQRQRQERRSSAAAIEAQPTQRALALTTALVAPPFSAAEWPNPQRRRDTRAWLFDAPYLAPPMMPALNEWELPILRKSQAAAQDAPRWIGYRQAYIESPHRSVDLTPRLMAKSRWVAVTAQCSGYPLVMPIPIRENCYEPATATLSDQLVVLSNMNDRLVVVRATLC